MRLYHLFIFVIIATIVKVCWSTPTFAQECISLLVVGSQDTEVQRTIHPEVPFPIPSSPDQNNANWSVPQDQHFTQFIFTLIPQSDGSFDIAVTFKNSDGNLAQVVQRENQDLQAGQPFEILVNTVDDNQPVQVQMYIGGQESVSTEYTVSAKGCL